MKNTIMSLLRSREFTVATVLIVVVVATATISESFVFSIDGWRNLLVTPALLIILAVGQAAVIITRNVDLSVGSVLGLTAYMTGRLFIEVPGIPIVVVVLAAIGLGAVLGLINGTIVAYAKVPALVVTLGTLYIYRGIFLTWAGSDRIDASEMPGNFLALGTQQIGSIPVLTIVALVVVAAVGYYMHNARGGREMYAIGSDPDVARLYGLNVNRRIISAFVLSGALAGLAGVVFAARFGSVSSSAGFGIEFEAVGAAVIGGVAIFGGSGSIWGAAIGAALLVTINRALPVLGVSDFWQKAVLGALILAAIVLDRVMAARQEKRLSIERESPKASNSQPDAESKTRSTV